MEVTSIIASIISVILAGFAIWLSITFWKMSRIEAERTRQNAYKIEAGVERLEKLFDILYKGMFGMTDRIVSDMRRHIFWPETSIDDTSKLIERKADEKVAKLKAGIISELSTIITKSSKRDEGISVVHTRLEQVVDKIVSQSRRAEKEAREETLRTAVLEVLAALAAKTNKITILKLVETLHDRFDPKATIEEILRLRDEGLIEMPDDIKSFLDATPDTLVILKKGE